MIEVRINEAEELKKYENLPDLVGKSKITISSQTDYERAAEILKEVKSYLKQLEEDRKKITKPLDEAKKSVMELFRKPTEMLETVEREIKASMVNYMEEQERIARQKQIELQKLAEIEAERERKRLEKKLEKTKTEAKAEEIREEIRNIIPIAPIVTPSVQTPKNISYREKWSAVVVDFKALPDEYKIPNQQLLDKVAQSTKGTLNIPGVKWEKEKITVVGGK